MLNLNDPYLAYYRNQQVGHGISSVYRGASYQRGHGIGSFLGGLFRTVAPLIKSGASAFGKEALRAGVGTLGDIVLNGMHPKQAVNTRVREMTGTLKRKADDKVERVLRGGGKKKIRRVTPQSIARLLQVRTSAQRKKRKAVKKRKPNKKYKKVKAKKTNRVRDIFL